MADLFDGIPAEVMAELQDASMDRLLEPERQKLARTVLDFIPQMTAFTDAVVAAIRDLDGSHYPTDYGDGRPELCAVCGAADGSWPCTARQVADDLRRAIGGEGS